MKRNPQRFLFFVMENQRQEIIRGVIHHVNEEPNFDSFDGEKAHPPVPLGHIDTGSLYKGGSDYDLDNDTQASLVNGALPIKALDEHISDLDRGIANDIIQKTFIKLGIHAKPQYEGEGTMGYSFTDGSRSYKITTDISEAAEAQKMVGKSNKYLADVYEVHQVQMTGLKTKVFLIVMERLKTDFNKFGGYQEDLDDIFGKAYDTDFYNMLELFRDYRNDYDVAYKTKIKPLLDQYPDQNKFWHQLLLIVTELKQNGIDSLDLNYNNLGYKQNGKLGFFDYGYSGDKSTPHVDTLALENMIYERITSYMKGSQAMTVKKKCQLGGNGDGTSTACNQGDINNVELKTINENPKKGFTLHDMITETVKISLNQLPFKNDLEKAGGKVFSVGGAVRDALIGKESKDLDLLVTGLPLDRLESLLMKYGKVDTVGKSFGVIKFNSPQTGELDIAIPRTERPTGQGGYQGFDVTSDHKLPIEKDLERRDFTINAIAKDASGKTVDPYGGEQDIQNKVIRMVNPQAFSDDPLRMIRAVQFAARFGFTIEPKTFEAIQQNASKIKEISPERILIEFDKIVKKGSPAIGAQLLVDTGLYHNIFGVEPKLNIAEFNNVKTMGEFIYQLTKYSVANPAEFYKTKLKGDFDTYNEIKAYDLAYKDQSNNPIQNKLTVFAMYKIFPASVDSLILPDNIKNAIKEMRSMGMPFSFKELQVNGNDLLAMGYSGQQIGQILKNLLIDVYSGKVRNNNQLLLRQILPVDQNPTKNK